MRKMNERELAAKSTEWLVEEEKRRSVRDGSIYLKTSEIGGVLEAIRTGDFSLFEQPENLEKIGWVDTDDINLLSALHHNYKKTGKEGYFRVTRTGSVFPLYRFWLIRWYLEN